MFSHPPSERELENYYGGGSGWENKFDRQSDEEDARKRREKLQHCLGQILTGSRADPCWRDDLDRQRSEDRAAARHPWSG